MALADPQPNFSENKLFVQRKKTCPDFLGSNPLPRCSSCLCSRRLAHPAAEAPAGGRHRERLLGELRSDSLLRRGIQWARGIPGQEHPLQGPSLPMSIFRHEQRVTQQHPTPPCAFLLRVGMRRDICTQRGSFLAEQVLLVSATHKQDAKLGLGAREWS